MMPPARIHIVGGPGSGKTTFGRYLAARLRLPFHEIDLIAEQCGLSADLRPLCVLEKRLADIHQIASDSAWVTEGTALWWTDELWREADVIVWLDTPWHVSLCNVLKRELGYYLHEIRAASGPLRKLRAMRYLHVAQRLKFIRFTWMYYQKALAANANASTALDIDDPAGLTRAAAIQELRCYAHKVVRRVRTERIAQERVQPSAGQSPSLMAMKAHA